MKHIIILMTLLAFTNCTKQDFTVPDSITERGQVDATLITGKLLLSYTVKWTKNGPEYLFKVNCPALKDPNSNNYVWHPKWSYIIKTKSGIFTKVGPLEIPVKPIDYCSVYVEMYCQNKYTNIKSQTISTGLIIKI